MRLLRLFSVCIAVVFFTANVAQAASTAVGVNVSRGQSDSMAYNLNILQSYEAWINTETFELTPLAEIGGHAWVPDNNDADTVWGAYAGLGMRFGLFTTASFQPFLEATAGGSANSEDMMDDRDLGSNVLFRTRGSVGVSFGDGLRHTVRGDYVHNSNAGLSKHNDGYNTYGVSYNFSF